jgi:hypothetical protein
MAFKQEKYGQEDYYYLMELLRRMSLYGEIKNSEKVLSKLVEAESKWLTGSNFDVNTWSLNGKPYSVETTKVAAIIAKLMEMGKLG